MDKAGLFHQCRSPYAYPIGSSHLRVVLKAARGDLDAAFCLFRDPYAAAADTRPMPLDRLGDDGLHDYWGATLPVPTQRAEYFLFVQGASGETAWLSDDGIWPRRPAAGYFKYPYIHRGDQFGQPGWIGRAVFYQVFPDRFCNGDPGNDPPRKLPWGALPVRGDMESSAGGDLEGIRQRLGYLKELGIGCIYATPIFQARSNHKYDTADYYRIDPQFGSNEEFQDLIDEVHQLGMRFLLDAVFNHSGSDWFAFRDVVENGEDSPYKDWFYHLLGFPVDPAASNYETFGNFNSYMPKLDTTNPGCREYLLKVAEHWIRYAMIDGWRLDVANEVDHGFWRAFRARVKQARPDAFILGEVWHDASRWLEGDQWDSAMNYPWRAATLAFLKDQVDAVEYDRWLARLRFAYPAEVRRGLVNLLGSHDTPRIRTEVASRGKAALAAVLLLTAEGVPMVYYGDEIGMEGAEDPDCRRCYPWDSPEEQDLEMLALYRRLIAIRNAFPWLGSGAWQTFCRDPLSNVLGYLRQPTTAEAPERAADEPGISVVINNSAQTARLEIPGKGKLRDLLAGTMVAGELQGRSILLPPRGAAVLAPASLAAAVQGVR